MNREYWAKNLPDKENPYYELKKAFSDGFIIEVRQEEDDSHWVSSDNLSFDCDPLEYRIIEQFQNKRVRRFI